MTKRAARQIDRGPCVLPSGSTDAPIAASPDEPAGTPPAKRRKTLKEATRAVNPKGRKTGRLSVLPTLPLDILCEVRGFSMRDLVHQTSSIDVQQIFGQLDPVDLLNLARTTKAFRAVLLSQQSRFLWKSVLDAFEGGDELHYPCPEDVSIPVWVNLIYGGESCDVRSFHPP